MLRQVYPCGDRIRSDNSPNCVGRTVQAGGLKLELLGE
jgi:hypothetical protein